MRSSGLIRIGGRMSNVHEDLFHLILLLFFFLSFFLYFILLYYSNKYSLFAFVCVHWFYHYSIKGNNFYSILYIHMISVCIILISFDKGAHGLSPVFYLRNLWNFWQMVNCFQFCFRVREKLSYSFREHV